MIMPLAYQSQKLDKFLEISGIGKAFEISRRTLLFRGFRALVLVPHTAGSASGKKELMIN